MTLINQQQLDNTRTKLAKLESRYRSLRASKCDDKELREASLLSLKRYINQFKEEIARYEVLHSAKG